MTQTSLNYSDEEIETIRKTLTDNINAGSPDDRSMDEFYRYYNIKE